MKSSAMHGESGYERIQNDAYMTPDWCVTHGLLPTTKLRGKVWEPAAGTGNICIALERKGYYTTASDIAYYGFTGFQADFFGFWSMLDGAETIVTNPPYDQAEMFIRHALKLTEPCGGMVAMLLRNEYDCAKSRKDLWGHPFDKKIVLTKRPKWSDSDKASPRHNFAWYVWDWSRDDGPPTMEWAP